MANIKTWGYIKIDGKKAPGLLIQVVDMDALDLAFTVLGTTTTNSNGRYEVSYSPEKYKKFELNPDPTDWMREKKPDIRLRVSIPAPFMNFVTYVLVSSKKANVSSRSLRFDWDIPKSKLGLASSGVVDLIEKLKDSIPEFRQERWINVKGLLQDLFNEIQQGIENFLQDEAPAGILRDIGNTIYTRATSFSNSVRNIPIIGGRAADLIITCGQGLKTILHFFADRIENLIELIKQLILFRPDSEHRIYWSKEKRTGIPGVSQKSGATFNTSKIDTKDGYNDSGNRYRVDIVRKMNKKVVRIKDGDEVFYIEKAYMYTKKRKPGKVPAPNMEMVAVDGNRLLAKAEGTDQFFFTTLYDEFPKQIFRDNKWIDVPGCYLKLDPEDNQRDRDDTHLQWWTKKPDSAIPTTDSWDHPGMNGYNFMPFLKDGIKKMLAKILGPRNYSTVEKITDAWGRTINEISPVNFDLDLLRDLRFFPDIQMIKVQPKVWHELDSRPPYGSGSPVVFDQIPLYKHITYETVGTSSWRIEVLLTSLFRVLAGIKEHYYSYDFKEVLSLGVAYSHRHTHYEDIYGTEINSGPDHYLVGQILDRGGFWDGTCNFYALVRLKKNKNKPYSYGILWIDEQSYFSEHWRLLHPKDNDWGRLREWGMAGALKRVFTLETLRSRTFFDPIWKKFWCPFKNKCIRDHSRMAVAKYIIVLTGILDRRHVIFSIGYNWGGMDRSWRWRPLTAVADTDHENVTNEILEDARRIRRNIVLTKTIGLRGDMTIHLKGVKVFANKVIKGRWFQKYLPADNQEVPQGDKLIVNRAPSEGYSHQWRFMSEQAFAFADNYSHFGHYSQPVSFRSQFYPVVDPPPQSNETDRWIEEPVRGGEYKLYTIAPAFSAITDNPVEWLKKSPEEKLAVVKQLPPSMFNTKTILRIVKCGIAGWIALHWDKRDDDLYPFWIPEDSDTIRVRLRRQEWTGREYISKEAVYVILGRQKRKWCPPVVQRVRVEYQAPSLIFTCESKIVHKPKSLIEPFFDEMIEVRQTLGRYEDRMRKYLHSYDNDPYDHCYKMLGEIAPAYGNRDNARTDYSIWHMHIFIISGQQVAHHVILPVDRGNFVSKNEFKLKWDLSQSGAPTYQEVKGHFTEYGMAKSGSSITFEDIIGHIASPQEIEYLQAT